MMNATMVARKNSLGENQIALSPNWHLAFLSQRSIATWMILIESALSRFLASFPVGNNDRDYAEGQTRPLFASMPQHPPSLTLWNAASKLGAY